MVVRGHKHKLFQTHKVGSGHEEHDVDTEVCKHKQGLLWLGNLMANWKTKFPIKNK